MPFLRYLFVLLAFSLMFVPGWGQPKPGRKTQPDPGRKTNPEALKKISEERAKKYKAAREKALALAKKHNWQLIQSPDLSLQGLSDQGKPLFYANRNNAASAVTTNTNRVWSGGSGGFGLNGSSGFMSGKLGIWDGGAVRQSHQELSGRIVNRDGASNIEFHPTHVAGTMIARGLNPNAKGMAFRAPDLQSWSFSDDQAEIAAAASSLLVSNHSYGYIAGWYYYNGKWYWLGDIKVSKKDDVYFGYYDYAARTWDEIAYNAPFYLMVKSAGNSKRMQEPAVGTTFFWFDPVVGDYVNAGPRPQGMRSFNSYDVLPDHSVAKNIITVGAIAPLYNGYKQPSDVVDFIGSSWGPTDDGRIKPDLVASGIQVTSSASATDDDYSLATGTSMAAPNVSGSLFLLQEHHARLNNGAFMRSATLKGLALHTTSEAGAALGPDYSFGWGLLNTERAAKVLSNPGRKHQVSEKTLAQGGTYTQTLTAAGSDSLRITICWTDPAGNVIPLVDSTALNNRSPRLINDLDIRISHGTETFYPWVLDPNNPAAAATTGDNFRDNVEQILIPNPVPGDTYTLTISHKGTLQNSSQDYALLISGLQGTQYCSSAPAATGGARIENLSLGTLNNSSTTTCGGYSDFTALSAPVEAGQVLPLSVTLGSCGADTDKVAKVFIDWNEDGDFADAGELAATSTVMPGSGTFAASIAVPTTIRAGNSTRMRVVVVETSDPAAVTACGTYGQGETEDYTLRLRPAGTDVGITALHIPDPTNFYANSQQRAAVKIWNNGTAAQTNIPVQVTVTAAGSPVATLTGTFTGTLAPGEETLYTLPGSFLVLASTTYGFTASTTLAGDLQPANDSYTVSLTSAAATAAPRGTATSCTGSDQVTLKGSGTGTLYWYDAATGGNLLAVGANTTTTYKPADKTYYVAANDFQGTTATLFNNAAGSFSATRDTIFFNAGAPFVLDKVSLHAGAPGTITLHLIGPAKNLIASTQLQVVSGVQEYGLNFTIPAAGNKYRLVVSSFAGGAKANRNDAAGTVVFPYQVSTLLTITGNSSANKGLYLFNWQVKAKGSASSRAAVKANGIFTASADSVCTGTLTLSKFGGRIVRWERSVDQLTWTPILLNDSTYHTDSLYTFSGLGQTTLFRVILADGACTEALTDTLTATFVPNQTVWTGKAGTDWFNPGNWSCQVPDSTSRVIIPRGLANNPVISTGKAVCRDLVIAGSLNLSGGTINLSGNFSNNGTFSQAGGTLQLTGPADHVISGNEFLNLKITGSGTTAIQSDILVNGNLEIIDGTLNTGAYAITLGPGASITESATHFVTGRLAATRTFDGLSTSHTFGGMGLSLNIAASPGDIQVIRTTGAAPGKTAVQRSFGIHVLDPEKNTGLNATMEFTYLPHELNGLDKNNLALFRSTDDGLTWALQSASVADTTRGIYKVSMTGINAFSTWTAADRFSNTTLALKLLTFQAVKKQTDVVLYWETAMEVNSSGIAIEVSADAENYRQLGFVPSRANNTPIRQQYSFTDREAGKGGVRYYRLRQVDQDGTVAYYGPRAVTFDAPAPALLVYPNPSSGSFHLIAQGLADGPMKLEIKNAAGQQVYTDSKQIQKGHNQLSYELGARLSPGLYLCTALYDHQLHRFKLVVQ